MEAEEEGIDMEMRDAPPAHLLIEIQSFSKLSKQESREFVAGNYRWRLAIFPNECDHISVYLCVAEAEIDTLDVPVNANCSIFLHNQISDNYLCYRRKAVKFDAVNWKWGFSMSKRTLCNGYLVDDKLVFGAEVFVSETTRDINECLCLFDFKISNFSKLKGVWYSQVLRVGGLRWKVMVYPNGDKSSRGQSVSIYLKCADSKSFAPHEQVKLDYCFRIRNNLPHHSHRYKSGTSRLLKSGDHNTWGYTNFIPIADMRDPSKGFIAKDCCFLDVQIYVQDVVYTPKHKALFN